MEHQHKGDSENDPGKSVDPSTSKLSSAQRDQLKNEMGSEVWEYYNIKRIQRQNREYVQKLEHERMNILGKKPELQDKGRLIELDKLIKSMEDAIAKEDKKIAEYPDNTFQGYTYFGILGPMDFEDWPAWNNRIQTTKDMEYDPDNLLYRSSPYGGENLGQSFDDADSELSFDAEKIDPDLTDDEDYDPEIIGWVSDQENTDDENRSEEQNPKRV